MFAKVALVEAHGISRSHVTELLETRHEVVTYESAEEALRDMAEEYPDLIVMNVALPDMDGSVALKKLRENVRLEKVPAIALTPQVVKADANEEFRSLGFDAYYAKPILDSRAFMKMVDQRIQMSSLR